ncbi:hypothetical protein J7384_15805 [Endozoicomonas sp. G2_1]|uniref:hypothetical protein n=1 Tax=Endozoicomonas sp. G2_1 TaxID=2821091 RepID=UPI001ADC90DD|nr:hypothetical protein [Endozoicomonas sp. G2_1]MBO9491825.1 hypothetical protein [Endozoicomonas sp. G2_1]
MKFIGSLFLFVLSFSVLGNEQETIENFYGTFGYPGDRLIIYPASQQSVVFYISLHSGPPNYSGSSMFGKATLRDGKLYHSSYTFDSEDYRCEFVISMESNKAKITMLTSNRKCGFLRYGLDGTYTRMSKTPESKVQDNFTDFVCYLEDIANQLRETNEVKARNTYSCAKLRKNN